MKNNKKKFSLKERRNTLSRGVEGISNLMFYEPNAWFDVIAAIIVIIAGIEFQLTSIEWIIVVFAIGVVLATAAINIAIELIADSGNLPNANVLKSLSAASLLITNIAALIIGIIVFTPKLITLP